MSEDLNRQKIQEMAKLTMLTDRISEIQIKNLKMYPFVYFEGISSVTIKYDLSNKLSVDSAEKQDTINYSVDSTETNHLKVSYNLVLDERLNDNLSKRFQALEESVRTLFWKQVSTEIFFNDKKVYESKNV